MTERDIKITAQKIITGEKIRLFNFKSDDAVMALSYILHDIFMLTDDEIVNLLSLDFLKDYDLTRYMRLIEPPKIYKKVKLINYIIIRICTDYELNYEKNIWERYIETLRNRSLPTFWETYQDVSLSLFVTKLLIKSIFSYEDYADLLYGVADHEEEVAKILEIFRLDDFYKEYCFCVLDLIFFSFPDEEKNEFFEEYLALRREREGWNEIMENIGFLSVKF